MKTHVNESKISRSEINSSHYALLSNTGLLNNALKSTASRVAFLNRIKKGYNNNPTTNPTGVDHRASIYNNTNLGEYLITPLAC